MYCEKCGSEITDNSKFCERCGAAINVAEIDESVEKSAADNNKQLKAPKGKKGKIIIGVTIAIIVIITAVVGGYYLTVANALQEDMVAIETCCEGFEQAERSEQVEIYHNLQAQYAEYQNSEEPKQEVLDEYVAKLQEMKKFLTTLYDEEIAKNTIENLDTNEDIDAISVARSNLGNLAVTIEYEDIAIDEYADKIDELVLAYDDRVAEIEAIMAEIEAAKVVNLGEQVVGLWQTTNGNLWDFWGDYTCELEGMSGTWSVINDNQMEFVANQDSPVKKVYTMGKKVIASADSSSHDSEEMKKAADELRASKGMNSLDEQNAGIFTLTVDYIDGNSMSVTMNGQNYILYRIY